MQESNGVTSFMTIDSIMSGAAGVRLGVVLTFVPGGLGPIVLVADGGGWWGSLSGAGTSSVVNPISKKISAERMTAWNYATGFGVGAVSGLVCGSISAASAGASSSLITGAFKDGCKRGSRYGNGIL